MAESAVQTSSPNQNFNCWGSYVGSIWIPEKAETDLKINGFYLDIYDYDIGLKFVCEKNWEIPKK